MSSNKNKEADKYFRIVDETYFIEPSGAAFRYLPVRNSNAFTQDYISNFAFIPEKRIYEYSSPERTSNVYYKFRPLFNGRFGAEVDLDKEKIRKKNPDIYTHRGERVYPGTSHLAAFQDMSIALMEDESISEEIRFTFMGLTEIEGKGLVFLNQGHSIDKNGPLTDYTVQLPDCYSNYRFIENEKNYQIQDCISTTTEVLETIWPSKVSIPLLSYVVGSFVNHMHAKHGNENNSILFIVAKTGSGKSTLVKFALSLFSIYTHAASATISLADTSVNAMKTILCSAYHAPVLVDDLRLNETAKDKDKFAERMNALTETVGNRTYKQILNGDSTLALPRISHASPIITGEQEPELSPAANARITTVEFEKNEDTLRRSFPYQKHLDKINLTGQDLQLFFIQNFDQIDRTYDERMDYYASLIPVGGHERITYNITHFMFDFHVWDLYLLDRQVITKAEYNEREKRMESIFIDLAAEQNERVKQVSVTAMALSRIKACLNSGRRYCQILDLQGYPRNPEWKNKQSSTSTSIGYLDKNKGYMYLNAEETYKAIEEYGPFPTSATTLWKMMRDEGLITPGESNGKDNERRPKRKVKIGNGYQRLIALKLSALDEDFEPDEGGTSYGE